MLVRFLLIVIMIILNVQKQIKINIYYKILNR